MADDGAADEVAVEPPPEEPVAEEPPPDEAAAEEPALVEPPAEEPAAEEPAPEEAAVEEAAAEKPMPERPKMMPSHSLHKGMGFQGGRLLASADHLKPYKPFKEDVADLFSDMCTLSSRFVELLREWDDDENGTTDRHEFKIALPVLELEATQDTVREVVRTFFSVDSREATTK